MVVARDLQERIGFYELGRNEGSFNRLARFVARTVDGGLEKFYDKLGGTPALASSSPRQTGCATPAMRKPTTGSRCSRTGLTRPITSGR